MLMWLFLIVCDLMIPIMMIFFGISYKKHPPAAINDYEGYRTRRSKKSIESWNYAHKYWGRLSSVLGALMLPLSILPFLFVIGMNTDIVAFVGGAVCFVQIIMLFVPLIATESALKRNFDDDGKSKNTK